MHVCECIRRYINTIKITYIEHTYDIIGKLLQVIEIKI